MTKEKAGLKDVLAKCVALLQKVRRYSFAIFLVFVALLYGFVLLRINTLGKEQPSGVAVSSQVKNARIPHIDQLVVKQLQSLQDNSVNVKSLFNQARNNPFQE
jgi:hypothetical protein